jgi:predicted glycogen debranching enzyme
MAIEAVVRRVDTSRLAGTDEAITGREWLVTNGLGGYASGSLAGVPTRRFHGWLIAALPSPLGRANMLNHLQETLRLPDGRIVTLGGASGAGALAELRLESGLPVWRYVIGPYVIERRVVLVHLQNTVHVLKLRVRPAVGFRHHEGKVDGPTGPYALHVVGERYELASPDRSYPPLRLRALGDRAAFTHDHEQLTFDYAVERARGYDHAGALTSPGFFRCTLAQGRPFTLIASTEAWDAILALSPDEALEAERERRRRLLAMAGSRPRSSLFAELVLAADQFIITPAARVEDGARAHASGDEARTVIAGYHWFTDWGRDTMISLEGLTLLTGRHAEAGCILRTFAHYVRDGLVPNMFPEGQHDGLYHTADASLWFFHAVSRYVECTGDRATLRLLLPVLRQIADAHLRGTRFGIGVDPEDGLLRQGAPGYQLTWMDAKVDDWVVTPRRGKAVEINALFYNALCLLGEWLAEEGDREGAAPYRTAAARVRESFNARFWYEEGQHLYDVIDGEGTPRDDAALRPNQLLAISLANPVLRHDRWRAVLDVCQRTLLTPVGLRSLAPGHPDYKARYFGDLRARDAAYHQGTVWAWLIGPFADAWRKVHPEGHEGLRQAIAGFAAHMDDGCVGSVNEVFDAEAPFTPRGCIAQAWSVAELLRCLSMLDEPIRPPA